MPLKQKKNKKKLTTKNKKLLKILLKKYNFFSEIIKY